MTTIIFSTLILLLIILEGRVSPTTPTITMMGTRRQKVMAKELGEICLLNKKKHLAERQQHEAAEKRKQDEEEEK